MTAVSGCTNGGSYPKGSRPTVRFTFEEVFTDDAFDPTSIDVITRDPSGDELSYTKASSEVHQAVTPVVGEWFFTFPGDLDEVGKWFVYVNGDGGVRELSFTITGVHATV